MVYPAHLCYLSEFSVGTVSDRVNFRAEKIFWNYNLFSRSDLFSSLFCKTMHHFTNSWLCCCSDLQHGAVLAFGAYFTSCYSDWQLSLKAVAEEDRFGSSLSWKYFYFRPLMPMQISLQIIALRKQSWQNMLLTRAFTAAFLSFPGWAVSEAFLQQPSLASPHHCRDPLLSPGLFYHFLSLLSFKRGIEALLQMQNHSELVPAAMNSHVSFSCLHSLLSNTYFWRMKIGKMCEL